MSAMAGGATNKIVGSASLNRVKRTLECRELSLAERLLMADSLEKLPLQAGSDVV
ncbi:hypothetical protein [Paraburkholderia terrae]|uniref:hypothetical protein n=1 Tax=Paraburkholderia terrae TaxID=311230 RepID=UPI0012E010CE|nr:hypothetical protein [Paraburkholderia terrae]